MLTRKPLLEPFLELIKKKYLLLVAFFLSLNSSALDTFDLYQILNNSTIRVNIIENYGTDNKENGIILCKNHHKAFDDNYIKINPTSLRLEISKDNDEKTLRINKENLKHLKNKPAFKYLKWRYENYKPFKS